MKLMDFLPVDYKKSPPTVEIQNALDRMCGKIETDVEDLRKQFFLSTATWGLNLWEWLYGIETDPSREMEWRRSRVGAKIRGKGTTTVEMMKNTAEAYVQGAVDIIEYNDEYRFEVVMADIVGIPPNMDDLQKTIEEIKPAHLNYAIIIRYNTWGMAEEKGLKWADLAGRTWKETKEVAF